ncbi:MAG: hypothetical protein GY757_00705 [bacterium]|nr:hypothetical protein [bacterium]
MNRLKAENLETCFALLREFIDGADALTNQKGIAGLALNQLRRITAGTGDDADGFPVQTESGDPGCITVPRMDGNPLG